VRLAAIFSVLACGVTAAMWLRVSPVLGNTGYAPAIGLVAGALLCGLLLDRWSYKAALILGLLLLSGGLWRLVLGPSSPIVIVLTSGALTAGAAMSMVAANALILSSTALSDASALAVLNVVLPVGMLCNPILSPAAISCAAAILATGSLACAVLMPMPPGVPSSQPETAAAPRLVVLMAVLALYGVYEGAIWNCLVEFFGDVKVLEKNDAWLVLSYGVPLGLIVGRIGSARILTNLTPSRVVRMSALTMVFAAGLMMQARSPSAAWMAAFCLGVTMSPVLPSTLAMAFRAVPRVRGLAMGVVFACGAIGVAASGPAIAGLSQRYTLPMALLLLPAVSLAMALISR